MLFHHSPFSYEPGDLIRCIGRLSRIQALNEQDPLRQREERFEEIRAAEFPDVVSRLHCNWAYEELTPALEGMRDGNPDPTPNLYVVELIDTRSRLHRGALDILNKHWFLAYSGGSEVRDELIRRYWRGEGAGPGGTELLIDGHMRVVKRLHDGQPLPEIDIEKLFKIRTDGN